MSVVPPTQKASVQMGILLRLSVCHHGFVGGKRFAFTAFTVSCFWENTRQL